MCRSGRFWWAVLKAWGEELQEQKINSTVTCEGKTGQWGGSEWICNYEVRGNHGSGVLFRGKDQNSVAKRKGGGAIGGEETGGSRHSPPLGVVGPC